MISVIIPFASEYAELQTTLTKILPERGGNEVIVVQQGTQSAAPKWLSRYPWVKHVQCDGPRPSLVNAGVRQAEGDILFILLPGMQPERGWASAISESVGKGTEAGSLRVAFGEPTVELKTLATGLNSRARFFGIPDIRSGLFLRRELFDRFGGWMEHEVGYDLEFSNRLRDHGVRWRQLPLTVTTPRHAGVRKGALWQLATSLKLSKAVTRRASQQELCAIAAHQQRAVMFWYEHSGPRSPATHVAAHIKGDVETAQRLVEPWLLQQIRMVEGPRLRADAFLCVDSKTEQEPIVARLAHAAPTVHLKDGRVGDRVAQTLEAAFAKGYLRAVTLNPQCPDLNEGYLNEAFDKLDYYDVVVGPTEDGGVHLLACKPGDAEVFRDIEWRGEPLELVLEVCRRKGLRVHTMNPLASLSGERAWRSAWNRGFLQGA